MGKPAARTGDLTSDAGLIIGPGAPNVLINGMPAARLGDMHQTPMVIPGTPPLPLVGGPIVGPGSATVFIYGSPSAVVGDMALTAGPSANVVLGSPNVLIGSNPVSPGPGGGKVGVCKAGKESRQQEGNADINGEKTGSVKIVNISSVKSGLKNSPNPGKETGSGAGGREEKKKKITIRDIVDILKELEKERGYQEASFFAGQLNYCVLCEMTMTFVEGLDTDNRNDPDQMPTRFMILYGADDSKLKEIGNYPDNFEHNPEHPMNVANMRKALLTEDKQKSGIYDADLYMSFFQYLCKHSIRGTREKTCIVKKGETPGMVASRLGLVTWKYLYQINKDRLGPDFFKPGTELVVPGWDTTTGDEKLKAAGANLSSFTGGLKYRYPWVPFSLNLNTTEKKFDEMEYRVLNKRNEILESGAVGSREKLQMLLPHVAIDVAFRKVQKHE